MKQASLLERRKQEGSTVQLTAGKNLEPLSYNHREIAYRVSKPGGRFFSSPAPGENPAGHMPGLQPCVTLLEGLPRS